MKKKLLCIALAFVFTVGLGLTAQAEDLALPAPSCILNEKDIGRSPMKKTRTKSSARPGVTKIMTLLLVLEALDNGSIGMGRHRHDLRRGSRQGRQPDLS